MLERTLYVQQSTNLSILEVHQILHSFLNNNHSFFYTGCRDHKWYRMSTPRAEQITDINNLFELLKEADNEEYPEAVAWLEKHHIPKAAVIYV